MSHNFCTEFLQETNKFGGKTAIIWRDSKIAFDEFKTQITKWAERLELIRSKSELPLRLALFCTNSPDIISIILASQLIGITVIPLNPSYKKYEINQYLNQCNSNFVIVSDDVELEKFEDIQVSTISEIQKESCNGKRKNDVTTSGVIIFFSSGTTGLPKMFEYNQKMLCSQIEQIKLIQSDDQFFSPSQSDVCFGVLPFFHAGGLITVFSMLLSGCTVIINERFEQKSFLSVCQDNHVSILFLVPPILHFLSSHPLVSNFNLSSIKTIFVGASASSPDDFSKIPKRIPSLENLIQLYGTTECGVLLCSTGKGISNGITVGKPYPLVVLKIDEKTNEIKVKCQTGVEEGYMETGDLGCFTDKTNELMIIGRSKEMIKIRGWQVNPNEIEKVIRKVESVVDCAVYQSGETGKLIAKVIGSPQDKNKILAIVRDNLASYKRLEDVIFSDELPRNASGKLVRHMLH